MKGFVGDIEKATLENANFRKVLYTGKHCQLVVMSLLPGEEIGAEVHPDVDQFFRLEQGSGMVIIDGVEHPIADKSAIIVPAGANHNLVNTGSAELKLYTVYSPPNHKNGTVHATKADAVEEHFDGVTTE